jgi:Ca2+-transporting ATPase
MISPHRQDTKLVLENLKTDEKTGLDPEEVQQRLKQYGFNELTEAPQAGWLKKFLDQFRNTLVLILLAATIVSFLLWLYNPEEVAYPYDSIIILLIVLANAILGFTQESRAEKSLEALKKMAAPYAWVLRSGKREHIPAREVVPGDILFLEAGDKVAADARLLQVSTLKVNESAFTGESIPVEKATRAIQEETVTVGDQKNMVFMGTAVTYGRGKAVVTATGMNTEIGKITHLLQQTPPEETPLQKNLDEVGKKLGGLILIICGIVFLTGLVTEGAHTLQGVLGIFMFGLALAVAAIPEGLPAVVTIALALGVQKMAVKNAIVRRLSAVETLGSTTVICSDKTGTLTRNEMTVRKIWIDGKVLEVTGEGYEPRGEFRWNQKSFSPQDPHLKRLLLIAGLCNNARLVQREEEWDIEGDPTEGALVVAAEKGGWILADLELKYPRLGEIPFSSERMRMITIHREEGKEVAYLKGAPEVVLALCNRIFINGQVGELTPQQRQHILKINEEMAGSALRTLAMAYRPLFGEFRDDRGNYSLDKVEQDFILVGLVGMMDPPRKEAIEAVATCKRAGMNPVMITGDHKLTAIAVARELDLIPEDKVRVITGKELEVLNQQELNDLAQEVKVYARVSPEHKVRIVEALKSHGHIVAMTGDGVNDAPALKKADIGVAMGKGGTEVAKEASDMILTDDNFATIIAAVEEGRAIFENIRKFISYLLSSNVGEVISMFVGVMLSNVLGFIHKGETFLPLTATQLLWVNLVTDGFPALALGVDPKNPDIMNRPPRDLREPVISKQMWYVIFSLGTFMGLGVLAVLDAYYPGGLWDLKPMSNPDYGRTMAFTTLVMFEMFNAFNFRSFHQSVFKVGIFKNRWLLGAVTLSVILQLLVVYTPVLQKAFHTVPLELTDWMVVILVSSTVLIFMEIIKLIAKI